MTTKSTAFSGPLLPVRKPWWIGILVAMVAFGFLQEDAKIKLNHYIKVGDRYHDFYTLEGLECDWKPRCMYFARKEWWDEHSPMTANNFYLTRETFDIFHWWGREQLVQAKWVLMVGIVLGFFLLDALFLRAAGVGERWRLLVLIYFASGAVVAGFWVLDGRAGSAEPGYDVAREVLGFLQSPLPSLMLVLLPWLRERALQPERGA